MDIALRNAMLIDGSGRPAFRGDLGIKDGRFTSVGKVEGRAREEIDVQGAAVAPGFIDVHTHYDAQVFWDPLLTPSIFHGVTTVTGGNCGFTLAPLADAEGADYLLRMLSRVEGMPLTTLRDKVKLDWRSFGEYLDRLEGKLALNTAFFVGHNAVRRAVMGERAVGEVATADDLARMKTLLGRSLAEGGVGFSTTVITSHIDLEGQPVPSRWAGREEMLELSRVLREYPGTWIQLVLNRRQFTEIEYALTTDMALAAQRPVNWNLLLYRNGKEAESQLYAADYARARGAVVHGQVGAMPPNGILSFVGGFFLDILPGWHEVVSLPHDKMSAALRDPAVRETLRKGLESVPDEDLESMAKEGNYHLDIICGAA